MHVVVIGAGVIGTTTAYYLSQFDCRVTVVDRAPDVAGEASFGNAGQLSYSFTDALAKPEFVLKIPALVAGLDDAYQVRLGPELVPWGMRFLSQCTQHRAAENTVAVLKTALRSEKLMEDLAIGYRSSFFIARPGSSCCSAMMQTSLRPKKMPLSRASTAARLTS